MNSLLSAIKAFVLKNRPAYKDYIGNGKYDVKKLPEECVPNSVNDNIRMALSTANAALSTANAALSTADSAQSTADSAQSTADEARSTVDTRLMVYGKSTETTVTIESLGAKNTATQLKNLGALNIENGSRISFVASDLYRDEVVWNGGSVYFSLNREDGVNIGNVLLRLRPDGNVEIINFLGENLTNVVITYRKIEVAKNYSTITQSGVWLPPYLCCSCIYLVSSQSDKLGFHPVYKITVDGTGTLKATEVT